MSNFPVARYAATLACLLLAACTYSDSTRGRHWSVELPTQSTVTINKTVRIIAPPGTTVIYGDSTPVSQTQPYPPPIRHNGHHRLRRRGGDW